MIKLSHNRIAAILAMIIFSLPACAQQNRPLPEWFDGNRVQAHTRLIHDRWLNDPLFFTAAEKFKQMGVNVFARHFITCDEPPCWPSKIENAPARSKIAKRMIDNAHQQGQRIIAYYWHMSDRNMLKNHPDWRCCNTDGSPAICSRGVTWMCMNSPFRNFVKKQLIELTDLGVDGFYLDSTHMPTGKSPRGKNRPADFKKCYACWCKYCRGKFKDIYGRTMPERFDEKDPNTKLLIDFYNRTLIETFKEWKHAVHQRNPDCMLLVSTTWTAAMTEPWMTSIFAAVGDSAKTEYEKPWAGKKPFKPIPGIKTPDHDMRWAAGFTYLRSTCDDWPPHSWIFLLWTSQEAMTAAAANLTYGLIANIDVADGRIPNMAFKPAFDLGNKVSPWLARTKPLRWTAIHFNEKVRDRLWPDTKEIWKKALWPAYGPFEALCRARLPVAYVTDWQLEAGKLDSYKVLVLPTPKELTQAQQKAVQKFKAAGGTVLEVDAGTKFHDPDKHDRYINEFLETLLEAAPPAPVKITGGPNDLHAVTWAKTSGKATTITLLNKFDWFTLKGRRGKTPINNPELIGKLPPPAQGVTAVLRTNKTPKKVFDAVSGKKLKPVKMPDGWQVTVPDFQYMAAVVFEW